MCKGGCKATWKALSTLVKVLLFCVVFMSIAVVVFFALFLTSLPKKGSGSDNKENQGNATNDDRQTTHGTPSSICETQVCKDASKLIRSKIDTSVKPCDDFYQFSCGKWIKNTQLGDSPQIISPTPFAENVEKKLKIAVEEPIQKDEELAFKILKSFYKGCMDTSAMKKRDLTDVKELINGIGGWPVVAKDQWKEDQFSWSNATYYFFNRGGVFTSSFLVVVGVIQNVQNSSLWNIAVVPPPFEMKEYFAMGMANPLATAYKEMIIEFANIFGADKTLAEKELSEVMHFKIKLCNMTVNSAKIVLPPSAYLIKDLEGKFPFIPWLEYIKAIMPRNAEITKDDQLIVNSVAYFEQVGKLLNDTSKRTLANYIIADVLLILHDFILNEHFQNATGKFDAAMKAVNPLGAENIKSRHAICYNYLTMLFPQLTGALYVRDFKDAHRKVLQDMLDNVLEVYTQTMKKIDWMDENTKKIAIEKIEAMKNFPVYFEDQKNYSLLNNIYKTLEIDDKPMFLSFLNACKFFTDLNHGRLRKSAKHLDSFNFPSNIIEANALYYPNYNGIVVQAGALQIPWFGAERPKYINYGSIGVIIGHEYTHGFDVSGSLYDKNGNIMNWWIPETREIFMNKTLCYIEQYDKYPMDVNSKLKVNGSTTLNENIADNGGIKHGFLAYEAWVKKHGPELKLPDLDFTPNQLYFISFAHLWCAKYNPEYLEVLLKTDEHAPAYARVLGPIHNSEFFAREFGCPANSPMNPSRKCVIW